MGIWLFDEKERQLALNVLQGLSNEPEDSDEYETSVPSCKTKTSVPAQLKQISVTDLLADSSFSISTAETEINVEKSPSILDLLSKAIVKNSLPSESPLPSLEQFIIDQFVDNPPPSSLKSFANSVCQSIQNNPQILTNLHRRLVEGRQQSQEKQ